MLRNLLLTSFITLFHLLQAQTPLDQARSHLQERTAQLGLREGDVAGLAVTSSHTDRKGVTHVYLQQWVHGLPVRGGVANVALKDGRVVALGDRLQRDLAGRAQPGVPGLAAVEALGHAARQLDLVPQGMRELKATSHRQRILAPSAISRDPIPADLVYVPDAQGRLRMAWDLVIRSTTTPNWWHVAVDAHDGSLLRTTDRMVRCHHEPGTFHRGYDAMADLARGPASGPAMLDGSGYRVFPLPTESPNHGAQVLVSEPADAQASPFGWHDVDGASGAEFTITRGNNVFATEDLDDDDQPGYSPDGGPSLLFDQAVAFPQSPLDYLDASITNMFYTCNVLHDVLHHYGFDEASGNFQATNYSGLGQGQDPVFAQAQDGGGMNNANFGTPPDGEAGVMQMYLWRTSSDSTLFVNSPSSIAGVYVNAVAGFGPPLPLQPITADVVAAEDATAPFFNACEPLTNAASITGRIALVDRGQCTFITKVLALQAAGAVAVIVVNNVPGDPIGMGGTGGEDIVIPSVMISQADGQLFRAALQQGPVNATLVGAPMEDLRDSGFDNGIIAHEYGHGVSNRLTGGAMDVDCLWNEEQMGEGWSDYLGMILTLRAGDTPTQPRGVGTFVRDQGTAGTGIRPAPYTTDMAVNGFTYGNTNSAALTQPHGVGFVWATMLWDLTWDLIGLYGLDPDLYTGTGGNNLALQLVLDGMKLQPCNPGFVDGRDAILLADQLLTGGQHECLIWNTFARRGLGAGASQGSTFSRSDQVEDFEVPVQCLSVGAAEVVTPNGMRLMPNPASGSVRMLLARPAGQRAELRILGADGRVVHTQRVPAGTTDLAVDIARLSPALYVLELRAEGAVVQERLVVE